MNDDQFSVVLLFFFGGGLAIGLPLMALISWLRWKRRN